MTSGCDLRVKEKCARYGTRTLADCDADQQAVSRRLDQSALAQLALHERVEDRGHHHAGYSECRLAEEDGEQDFPGLRIRLAADDAGVRQVLEFVDHDQ